MSTLDPAGPSACAVIAYPNTDIDAWDSYYAFEEDPPNYLIDALREGNYDPFHDPYADYRSIGAEFEGVRGAGSDSLINFAGQTGLPITFLPDISPDPSDCPIHCS